MPSRRRFEVLRAASSAVVVAACALSCDGTPTGSNAGSDARARTVCDGGLVDLSADPRNCGSCGYRCSSTTICSEGRCVGCEDGAIVCENRCVMSRADPDNCGVCGHSCSATETCAGGTCVVCPETFAHCDGDASTCGHDSLSSRTRCGGCRTCGSGAAYVADCNGGRCVSACRPGAADCDGRAETVCETALDSDSAHCGSCENVCLDGSFCARGRCERRSVQPRAPTSAMIVASARPWFRWTLPVGAEGARLQLCDTRSCDGVTSQRDVTGNRWRPSVPLAEGVHFWRLFALRSGAADATPGPVWELVVPAGEAPPRSDARGFLDVNGDGLEDRVVSRRAPTDRPGGRWVLDVYFGGRASEVPDQTLLGDESQHWDDEPGWYGSRVFDATPVAAGDVDGDGYGDLVARVREHSDGAQAHSVWATRVSHLVYFGGPTGLSAIPRSDDALWSGLIDNSIEHGALLLDVSIPFPVGDLDGDGFGDSYQRVRSLTNSPVCTEVLHLGGARFTKVERRCPVPFPILMPLVGDFDADGAVDLIEHQREEYAMSAPPNVGFYTRGGVAWRATPDRRRLDVCQGMPAQDPIAPVELSVRDRDDDGYDDLLATISGYPRPVTLLYRGGPDGLIETRCEALP